MNSYYVFIYIACELYEAGPVYDTRNMYRKVIKYLSNFSSVMETVNKQNLF